MAGISLDILIYHISVYFLKELLFLSYSFLLSAACQSHGRPTLSFIVLLVCNIGDSWYHSYALIRRSCNRQKAVCCESRRKKLIWINMIESSVIKLVNHYVREHAYLKNLAVFIYLTLLSIVLLSTWAFQRNSIRVISHASVASIIGKFSFFVFFFLPPFSICNVKLLLNCLKRFLTIIATITPTTIFVARCVIYSRQTKNKIKAQKMLGKKKK